MAEEMWTKSAFAKHVVQSRTLIDAACLGNGHSEGRIESS